LDYANACNINEIMGSLVFLRIFFIFRMNIVVYPKKAHLHNLKAMEVHQKQ